MQEHDDDVDVQAIRNVIAEMFAVHLENALMEESSSSSTSSLSFVIIDEVLSLDDVKK